VDDYGNIYVASSGPRGQMVDTSVFKIDLEYTPTPFTSGILNATGVAWGPDQHLYVSSREEGTIYRVAPTGAKTIYAEGMGVATGIVFDHERNLYCGDRSGTIFKIGPDRQIYVFATLEPSIAAYHLTAASDGTLYVSAPTTSSYDSVYCISPDGNVRVYYAGLGRPQGLALDASGNLHVAASLHGRRGVVRITPRGEASIAIAGSGIVGLAFLPGGAMALTTNLAVYYLALSARGQ
jgi:sugar lactone lactonase YvrE